MRPRIVLLAALLTIAAVLLFLHLPVTHAAPPKPSPARPGGSGSLQIIGKDGKVAGACPLEHTDVKAEISGFLARVEVTQEFVNPLAEPIEAVYVFPLPQDAAVNDMTMRVGERTIRGVIKTREQAREIYEHAKRAGQTAALLDQERPNIFTQSVANILPGEKITITIAYVDTLRYEAGSYEFMFPTVVGPRYIPGNKAIGQQGGGRVPDTDKVPDASRITPPVAPEGVRAGHDIAIEVRLDAGVPIAELRSELHQIDVERTGASSAVIRLKELDTIPNKDFILRYDVAGAEVADALLVHAVAPKGSTAAGGGLGSQPTAGFFTFILQPPDRIYDDDTTPRELVFVLDTSGSMHGFPIEKAKEAMALALANLRKHDTFNLITFSGDTYILFEEPMPATPENLAKAQAFLASRSGGGGTEMMKAIRAALAPTESQKHLRIAVFMTDGYVGNDMEIIGAVQKYSNARVFAFGIGNGVNRFLLDNMAKEGRGEVEYLTLQGDAEAAVARLEERIRTPLLTDVTLEWNGLPVADVSPARPADLFSAKPLVITGRYTHAASGKLTLRGRRAGQPFTREIAVELPAQEKSNRVLATLWARRQVADLMARDWAGAQHGSMKPELVAQVTQLGLDYRLMTQFTSFVAVEEMVVTEGGAPRTIQVPVEIPQGVDRAMAVGEEKDGRVYGAKQISNLPASQGFNSLALTVPGAAAPGKPGVGGGLAMRGQRAAVAEPEARDDKYSLKMSGELFAVLMCVEQPKANCGDGKPLYLRVVLADASPAVVEKLKQLGFKPAGPAANKVLYGELPASALKSLADLPQVFYISRAEPKR